MKPKRILITGGAGCLGSNLVEKYITEGHEVAVIDNFATSKREVLPSVPGLTVTEGSIVDKDLVDQVFRQFQPTHVIHSAASYKDPSDWEQDLATNYGGTISVGRAALKYGVERFLYFQTALVYGRPDIIPIPADHRVDPFTSYGISKLAGENVLKLLGEELSTVSFRLANLTGPRLCIGPIPTFYTRLKEGKSCFCSDSVRDFMDMRDFFSLMDTAIEGDAPQGIFNVSTGIGHTIQDVFDQVVEHLNIELEEPVPVVPVGADDVPAVVLDPSVTIESFNWRPQISFEMMMSEMLSWYDKHGVTDVYSHLAPPPSP